MVARWLLLALLFTAIARMLSLRDADPERGSSGDQPRQISRLGYAIISCHVMLYRLLLLCLPSIQLNSLLISVSSNGRTRIHHRIQSGATEEDNNNNNNNDSTSIRIEYTGQTDEPHPNAAFT
jgi:hypothetical protein